MLMVFTTVPNAKEAEALAEKIVETKLAACVQILPQMTSVYVWEGRLHKEPEHLLLIKTLPENWDALRELIGKNHSYSVPEIAAVDAEKVAGPYLAWLRETLGK